MGLFDDVFNPKSIHEMLFFNIKAVLITPTLTDLKANNPTMYERWKYLSRVKYAFDLDVIHAQASTITDDTAVYGQKKYEENAVQHPEFCKIVAITYGTVYIEGTEVKRQLKSISGDDEANNIDQFMDVLKALSSDGVKSTPVFFPTLCGHNIISYDIPLLIKRYLFYRGSLTTKALPLILKRALSIKPWESGIIDTVNVWKFNGFEYTPLMLISDFLGLKKKVDLISHDELSKIYWKMRENEPKKAVEFVGLQSATQTNLVIQLMNELRQV